MDVWMWRVTRKKCVIPRLTDGEEIKRDNVQKYDPSFPDIGIAPPPPNLNCDDVPYNDIKVEGDDPHGFDREGDGIGCES